MVVAMVVVVMGVVVTSPALADDPSLFEGCLVSPAFNISVGGRRAAQAEFWGFVGSAAAGPVMEVEVGEEGGFGHTRVNLTHTHASAIRVALMEERRQEWRVSGRVTAGWRRFLLAATWQKDALRLALTDDLGAAWLADAPPQGVPAAQWVSVAVPHFSTNCQALTPVWRVAAGAATEVPLSPLSRRLQFTLEGGSLPRLTLHHTELSLAAAAGDGSGQDTPPPAGPLLLRLTLDHTRPAAPPRLVSMLLPEESCSCPLAPSPAPSSSFSSLPLALPHGASCSQVAAGLRGVVEVVAGGPVVAMRLSGQGEGAFHVVQQLHVSPAAQDTTWGAAPCSGVIAISWPVLAGAAAALLLAGTCVGAGLCRLMGTRVEAAESAEVTTTTKSQSREEAASRKSESPYLKPRRGPSPPALPPPSVLVALPGSPAAALQEWRSAAVVPAPRKSVPLYLHPRPGPRPAPWPALALPPPRSSSPEDTYEYVDEAMATGDPWAEDSFTSDDADADDKGDRLYCN
ncbi:uncharacterized protein LOC126995415 isoform X1 [Eriocheir sinensis]|uniref:uncharacterized protein LOC126995415 isoform X1 n=1 Tax=Eriocheir sinensis TaxID=95602 RepID=UPI0021C587CF|nr:uncharacterized protein LOC126995415 isoform X1 [Eriocheir sinensis]